MNKQTIITALLALVAVSGWAQKVWTNPGYRNEPHGFQFDVNEVEFLPDETVLHITVKNHPNAKFSFGKCTVLKTEDGQSYPIISAKKTRDGETDLALDTHIPIPESGKTDVALHFQPLPQDVRQFDLIEGYARNFFKIWDITDPTYKKQASLFNSSWRNVETGEWAISLFNDYAVYNNKVWQYEKKSDKKIVLSSGNDKVTISIGKEKEGKRSFNIDGKKLTLSGPCRRHSIAMIPVYERYKDKGFTVVAIARERNSQAMENAAKKDGYPWPSLLELNDENGVWRKNGADNAGGAMYLIDRDGTILSTSTDAEELEPIIKKALNSD